MHSAGNKDTTTPTSSGKPLSSPGLEGEKVIHDARNGKISAMLAWAASLLDTGKADKLAKSKHLLALAERGDSVYLELIGSKVFWGQGFLRNEELGMLILNLAAGMGEAGAITELGSIALVRGEYEEAIRQFRAAVAVQPEKIIDAGYFLLMCKLLGVGMPKNPAEALAELREMAALPEERFKHLNFPGSPKLLAAETVERQLVDALFARYFMQSKGVEKPPGGDVPLSELEKLMGQASTAQDALTVKSGQAQPAPQADPGKFRENREAIVADAKAGGIAALVEWSRNSPQYATSSVRIENLITALGETLPKAAAELAEIFCYDAETFDLALGWAAASASRPGEGQYALFAEFNVHKARRDNVALMETMRKATASGSWMAINYVTGLILGASGKKDVALALKVLENARRGSSTFEAERMLRQGKVTRHRVESFFDPQKLSTLTERDGLFDIDEVEFLFTGEKSFRAYAAAHGEKTPDAGALKEKARKGDLPALLAWARLLKAEFIDDRHFEEHQATLQGVRLDSDVRGGGDNVSRALDGMGRLFAETFHSSVATEVAFLFYKHNFKRRKLGFAWTLQDAAVALADLSMRWKKYETAMEWLEAAAPKTEPGKLDSTFSEVHSRRYDFIFGLCLVTGVGGKKDITRGMGLLKRAAITDKNTGDHEKKEADRVARTLETGTLPQKDAILLLGLENYDALKRSDYTVLISDIEFFFSKTRKTEEFFKRH